MWKFTLSRRTKMLSKPYIGPVIVGFCLGVTLNIIAAPFVADTCHGVIPDSAKPDNLVKVRDTRFVNEEPRINSAKSVNLDGAKQNSPNTDNRPNIQEASKPKKLFRPRYVSTELGIKEKLFVAAITSPGTIDTFGVALNKTISNYVTKLIFFMHTPPTNPPPGLTVVSFSNHHPSVLPIHILKYIMTNFEDSFDFYMIITDRTYVRAEKVFDFVSHISVSQQIHMGSPDIDNRYCSLQGSVILSQSVVRSVIADVDWCLENAHPSNPSISLGICVEHASSLPCQDSTGDVTYPFFHVEDFDYDDDIATLRTDTRFNTSIVLYPMPDDISHYKVHRYFCLLELNQTRQEIDRTKDNIMKMSKLAPPGTSDMSWPLGVPEVLHGLSRFDVIRWAYFTQSDIYFDNDFSNVRPLVGVDKLDIEEILERAIQNIESKYKNKLQFDSLLNGYRRFDPTRGMEYILDMKLSNKQDSRSSIETRVHLLRPLGKMEIIPVPYVTEHTRIDLILPLAAEDLKNFAFFLEMFRKTCLISNDNTFLRILFLYRNRTSGDKSDPFAIPKSLIDYYQNKHKNQSFKISWRAVESRQSSISDFAIVDSVSRDFQPDSLVLLGTVGMELMIDFLNRVRMNTIAGWQVFFPISFWQYKLNLVYNKLPYPPSVELSSKYGFFNTNSYQHSSFYMSDYLEARRQMSPNDIRQNDLFSMFLKYKKLNVFRAAEPSLRHKWQDLACDPLTPESVYQQCLAHKSEGLASRSQLATLIFEQMLASRTHH